MGLSGSLFCRYCGSHDIINVKITTNAGSTKTFEPNIDLAGLGASVSMGSISRKKDVMITYPTKLCRKCLNIHVADPSLATKPVTVKSSLSQTSIVIPFTLSLHLKTLEYEPQDITTLVANIREKLDRIYLKKYSKSGINPCKKGRMGYKLKLMLKRRIKILCWVIIDAVGNEIVYRLCYGGGKVQCP
jgi:hypothetical protein